MMIPIQSIVVFFLIIVFLIGFIVLLNNGISNDIVQVKSSCPNLLVRNGNKLSLLNTNLEQIDGVNPLSFNSLEDYRKYSDLQTQKGIHCPVLYIQEENNAQGNDVYKMYSNPFKLEPGIEAIPLTNIETIENSIDDPIEVLDANRDNSPFNANNYPGFDPYGLNVGEFTKIDVIHESTKKQKDNSNAMDTNWNGLKQMS